MSSDMDANDDVPSPGPRIFDRYASSSDDDSQPSYYPSLHSTNRRLDYMIQFLDRNLLPQHTSRPAFLPEFVAKGGGQGIFTLPDRKAFHANRPPHLELRPHPLRETQVGRFLKTIAATDCQLWAGSESGALRVWEFKELYEEGEGEEEGTAPFKESSTLSWNGNAAVMCMVGDEGSAVVWSGHRDGRIRGWKMDFESGGFKEGLSWQAHRGPVLSIIFTCYGRLPFSFLYLCVSLSVRLLVLCSLGVGVLFFLDSKDSKLCNPFVPIYVDPVLVASIFILGTNIY